MMDETKAASTPEVKVASTEEVVANVEGGEKVKEVSLEEKAAEVEAAKNEKAKEDNATDPVVV